MSDEALALDAGVEYPTSDGRPVAESPLHYKRLSDAQQALTKRFESQPCVYVGVNMLVYDHEGDPKRSLSPDLFVALDVEERDRDVYKLWEDESPAFVLELTSKTTHREDERKKARYSRWGVAEYFLYDPRAEYVKPPLQGFELVGGSYRAMATAVLSNGKPGFTSGILGLGLWLDGLVLRFYDPETGRNLLTHDEELVEANAKTAAVEADLRESETRSREHERRSREHERRSREYETRCRQLEAELAEFKDRAGIP